MTEVESILGFLEENSRSRWINGRNLNIYVRRGFYFPLERRDYLNTLVLANIESLEPGRGIFTNFIEELERSSLLPIYIENVEDPEKFGAFFERRGYARVPNLLSACYIFDPSGQCPLP